MPSQSDEVIRNSKGLPTAPVEDAVKARLYDSRWDPEQLLDAKVLAEREMQAAGRRVDEAMQRYHWGTGGAIR